MKIGVPKEIKTQEHRVGLVPASVKELTLAGHEVFVEQNAGKAIHFDDLAYQAAGARITSSATELFATCDMIVKVKEPQASEIEKLRKEQILFTYLHLAADKAQTEELVQSGAVAIAYETVTDAKGGLPLLAPMSEVAGRLAMQVGATYLQKHLGGTGRLISGVPGVAPGKVTIIGGGVSGFHAAQMAVGLGAAVHILERNPDRLRELNAYFGPSATVEFSNSEALERHVKTSDIVIGAVLIPGASAPKLVKKEWLKDMIPGAVLVDIAIDQGGCFETSRATTHENPVYIIDNVIHYCVANMPGAVPFTSALALNNATLPYILQIANKGWNNALKDNAFLKQGLNICHGHVTYKAVSESLNLPYTPPEKLL